MGSHLKVLKARNKDKVSVFLRMKFKVVVPLIFSRICDYSFSHLTLSVAN